MIELLNTLFWTVTFCLGLYTTAQDGYILHFLQMPFIWIGQRLELLEEFKIQDFKLTPMAKFLYILYQVIGYIGSPLIMCITCMASFWGCAIFITLNGWHVELIKYMVINSFAAAFIQTFIWKLYAKINF